MYFSAKEKINVLFKKKSIKKNLLGNLVRSGSDTVRVSVTVPYTEEKKLDIYENVYIV